MKWVSISELADLTGKAWRTCKSRIHKAGLEANVDGMFPSCESLLAIYASGTSALELDSQQERARRDKEAELSAAGRRKL